MAKKNESEEMTKQPTDASTALLDNAKNIANMSRADQLRHLAERFGVQPGELEVLAAGKLPFWPAYAGAKIYGTVQNYRRADSKFGEIGMYTLQVEREAVVGANADGEIFEVKPGELITVLERAVMKNLEGSEGRKVGILCLGQTQGKEFAYWDYAIMRVKQPNPALPASQ